MDMEKIRKMATVLSLPQRLGIPQYVEYEPRPREHCSPNWCPNEGLLTAEGCRRGVCIKYRVIVRTEDGRRWAAPRRRWRDEDRGGCLRPQVAAALLELAVRYEIGVWYEKIETNNWRSLFEVRCGPVVNGIKLNQPDCRTVDECIRYITADYRQEEKRLKEPPPPDPAEELLREYPELSIFGREWMEKFAVFKHRLAEIAKVLKRYPWMAEVIGVLKEKPQPYSIFVLVAKDGSEAYLTFDFEKAYRAQNGVVKEVRLELERRYEEYNGKKVEVYRPKGLLAFAVAAKEYVRVL